MNHPDWISLQIKKLALRSRLSAWEPDVIDSYVTQRKASNLWLLPFCVKNMITLHCNNLQFKIALVCSHNYVSFIRSMSLILGIPLPRVPSIFPSMMFLIKRSCRTRWLDMFPVLILKLCQIYFSFIHINFYTLNVIF